MNDLHIWAPLLFVTGFLLVILQLQVPPSKYVRALASMTCIAVSIRYLYWRILFSFPTHQNILQQAWARCFLVLEIGTVISGMLVYFFMSRYIDRSVLADAVRNSPLQSAPVDVFIATFNEGPDILERTILGAKAIDHPDLRVWVLDDRARPWVRDLAEQLGALYVCRVHGKHAKAGNVNNGLRQALTHGRRPDFMLLLDADFVPNRRILKRVLGLFEEEVVGIVQTPQHFFNPDPVQSNLLCGAVWPDEQRFFFNALMPCKDAWDAAFCCGTSAVFRVAALEACGGMATETVTEDMLTSFKMREHGYRTIYLNERLSIGLAPESLREFISQRARWCLGAIQQIYTRWSFFRRNRVNFINRLAFFDSVLYWFSSAPFKLMLISAPMLYWLTGTSVIRASLPDLVYWLAPAVSANLIFMRFAAGNRVLPIITDVGQLLTVFAITRTVLFGLVRPFGHTFKVTAKGISSAGIVVQWHILWRYALLAVLSILGMVLHIAKFSPGHGAQGYSLNVVWSMVNAAILTLVCAVCVELPKRRREHRFPTSEEAVVRLENDAEIPCRLEDISVGGACLFREQGWQDLAGPAALVLDDGGLVVPFHVARRTAQKIGLDFQPDLYLRRALIVKIFTGTYHQDVEQISAPDVFRRLARAIIT